MPIVAFNVEAFFLTDLLLPWIIVALIVLTIYLLCSEGSWLATRSRPGRARRVWQFRLPMMFALTASAAVVVSIVLWAGDEAFNPLMIAFLAIALVFFVCVFYTLAIFVSDLWAAARGEGESRIHAFLTRRVRSPHAPSPLEPPPPAAEKIAPPRPAVDSRAATSTEKPSKNRKWWRRIWRNRYRPYVHGQDYTHPMERDGF